MLRQKWHQFRVSTRAQIWIQLFYFLGRNAWGRVGNAYLFQKKEVVMSKSIKGLVKK